MQFDKKAKNDGLTVEQREIVMRKARARTAEIISEGKVPEVRVRKEIQRSRKAHQEQEQSR